MNIPYLFGFEEEMPPSPSTGVHQAAHLVTGVPASSDFLRRAVFVYDETVVKEETDEPSDMILFFYPDDVPIDIRLFLIGGCSSMRNFCKTFSGGTPPQILCLEKEKFACREIGSATMVFTGPQYESDEALLQQLDLFYNAFVFFSGTFDHVAKRADRNHAQYKQYVTAGCKQLVPLIRQYDTSLLNAFNPLPYLALPPNQNRLFLAASQILSAVKEAPDNLAGCILYENQVLCTELSTHVTRFIVARFEYRNPNVATQEPIDGDGTMDVPEVVEQKTVFMNNAELNEIRRFRPPPSIVAPHDSPLSSLPSTAHDDGEFVGLYTCTLGKISLAVVMNLPALGDSRHLKKLKLAATKTLLHLDVRIRAAFAQFPGGRKKLLQGDTLGYQFFTYDDLTEQGRGPPIELSSNAEYNFLFGARVAHGVFIGNPAVSQIQLSNLHGAVYARKAQTKEVYFQRPSIVPSGVKTEDMSGPLREVAKRVLKKDHEIILP